MFQWLRADNVGLFLSETYVVIVGMQQAMQSVLCNKSYIIGGHFQATEQILCDVDKPHNCIAM